MDSEMQQAQQSNTQSKTVPIVVTYSQVQVSSKANRSSQTKRPSTYFKTTQTKQNSDINIQTDPIHQVSALTEVEVVHPNNNKTTCTDLPIDKHVQTYIFLK